MSTKKEQPCQQNDKYMENVEHKTISIYIREKLGIMQWNQTKKYKLTNNHQ